MKRSFEEEFGFNFTDRTKPTMPKDHFLRPVTDEKQQKLVEEICFEITKGMPTDKDLFDSLKDLPADLSYDILCQLNVGLYTKVDEMLSSYYFEQFIRDCNKKTKKGISNFDKRLTNQIVKNFNLFYKERLLTVLELESIFMEIYFKDNSLVEIGLYKYMKYDGENKYVKILSDARNKLFNVKAEENDLILNKIATPLLEKTLEGIKSLNIVLE